MVKGAIVIHEHRCKGCGLCVTACPTHMLGMSTSRFNARGYRPVEVTVEDACTGCGVCAIVCPDVAFSVFREPKRARRATAAA